MGTASGFATDLGARFDLGAGPFAVADFLAADPSAADTFFGADPLAFAGFASADPSAVGTLFSDDSGATTFILVGSFFRAGFAGVAFFGAGFSGPSAFAGVAFFGAGFSGTETLAFAATFPGTAFLTGPCTTEAAFAGSNAREPEPSARLRGGWARRTSAATVSSRG